MSIRGHYLAVTHLIHNLAMLLSDSMPGAVLTAASSRHQDHQDFKYPWLCARRPLGSNPPGPRPNFRMAGHLDAIARGGGWSLRILNTASASFLLAPATKTIRL